MKSSFGAVLGCVLVIAFVGAALAQGTEANATKVESGEKAGALLDAIRDRAKSASAKTVATVERKLAEISRQIDAEANERGDIVIAGRVAPEFGMRMEVLAIEQAMLRTGMGDLVIAHTLVANSEKNVTTKELFTLQREGLTWGRIAHGLNLRLDEVTAAMASEAHVAAGRAKADGRPATIRSATRATSNATAT